MGEWRGGGARCGVPDIEKIFTPQRTTSKTAAGDRGKLVKGFSRVTKQMEMKELMILMVVVANFRGWVFCSGKWLWKEKSTEVPGKHQGRVHQCEEGGPGGGQRAWGMRGKRVGRAHRFRNFLCFLFGGRGDRLLFPLFFFFCLSSSFFCWAAEGGRRQGAPY